MIDARAHPILGSTIPRAGAHQGPVSKRVSSISLWFLLQVSAFRLMPWLSSTMDYWKCTVKYTLSSPKLLLVRQSVLSHQKKSKLGHPYMSPPLPNIFLFLLHSSEERNTMETKYLGPSPDSNQRPDLSGSYLHKKCLPHVCITMLGKRHFAPWLERAYTVVARIRQDTNHRRKSVIATKEETEKREIDG